MKIQIKKTISNVLLFVGFIFFFSSSNSCVKVNNDEKTVSYDISGNWSFTIIPKKSYDNPLTDTSDSDEYPATFHNIFLYDNNSTGIKGTHDYFEFEGSRSGNKVTLHVYGRTDGDFDPLPEIKDLIHLSTMNLTINDYGQLEGNGIYLNNPDYDWAVNESYQVLALKKSNIDSPIAYDQEGKNALKDVCDILSGISSWLISYYSSGTIRTFGNCFLHKDGGGYYVFGHKGPGSTLPMLTETVYFPFEWSWCKVRRYHFQIKSGKEILSVEALTDNVNSVLGPDQAYKLLGFDNNEDLNLAIQDFYETYGGFSLSFGFSVRTGNTSFYVNIQNTDVSGAEEHLLIQNIKSAISHRDKGVQVLIGKDIHDYWDLRRSDGAVCNTPVLFFYLLGTNEVIFD